MISFIRSTAGSWVIKILFVLLIASFAVWGIGDIFRAGGLDQRVGQVGDRNITLVEVDRVFQDQLENLRRNLDPAIDAQTAIALGALDSAAQQVVAGALVDEAAAELDLRASDEAIALAVARNPSLQGLDGEFDPRILRNILAANGLTEEQYLAMTRRDNARQQVLTASSGAIAAPEPLVDAVYAYANERRSASFLHLLDENETDIAEPSADALQAYFDDNSDEFQAPEYRRIAYLTLGPEDLMDEVAVDEEQVRALYDERIDQFETPETRDFTQVIVQDEARATSIAEAAREAGSLEAGLEEIGDDAPSTVALDGVTRDGMLTPELGEAAFALAGGEIGDPIESPFGWHVLEVVNVSEGGTIPFEKARNDLEVELRYDAASDAVFEVANQVIDERAGGATLDEVAASFGLEVQRPVPVDRQGQPDLGGAAPDLPYAQALLTEAFALDPDSDSLLQEQPDGGYFAVAVEEVIPSRPREFEEVRDQVREAVMAEARSEAVAEKADQVVASLNEGLTLDAVAEEMGLELQAAPGFLRTEPGVGDLPAPAVEQLFAAEIGESVRTDTPEGEIVAVLTEIEPAESAGASPQREQLAQQLANVLRAELTDQLSDALAAEYPVELNRERLRQFYLNDQLGG